ncbi:hypothetical protein FRC17_010496 [Serendipita sp. 399]|nr:hypothetical protein FRC17_010496 [Serendipita sp. 399]
MFTSALAALFLASSFVRAAPEPLEPSSTSVFNEGGNCTILWSPDTTGVWKVMNIELMTGDNFQQVHLRTVATVDGTDAENHSFSYPCLAVTPNAPIYFYKFTSPASADILFTTRFTIADAEGNAVSATQSQTANGAVVAYGTGALEDPSLVDQPPVVGTASDSATAAPTLTTSRASGSSAPTTRSSVASTTVPTSRPNAGSILSPLSALTLGAIGVLIGSLSA